MNERIKELAVKAGIAFDSSGAPDTFGSLPDFLERFAELVRQDEREACAITAWSIGIDLHLKHHDIREVGSACATAIRARGNHEQARFNY